MKNLKNKLVLTFIVVFIGIATFQSCDSDNRKTTTTIENATEEFKIPETVSNAYVDGLKLPDGTKVVKIDDSTVEFIYPKGIELWIGDDNGNVSKVYYSGGYTCTCSGSKGCNVFYAGGDFGCSHGECTGTCTGTKSKMANNSNYIFVNTNKKLEPITNDNDFKELPYLPEIVLKEKKVQLTLKNFANEIYGNKYEKSLNKVDNTLSSKSDINDIIYIQMKMYGFKFIYGISMNDLKKEVYENNNFEKVLYGSHSCKCDSGTSGCKKGSSIGVKYCKGGACTTCTMTIK